MTKNYCMAEDIICSFEGQSIKVKLVKADTENPSVELFHVMWKSHLGKEFVNVLKKPTNYRDASELYFEMTNTCLRSSNNNRHV